MATETGRRRNGAPTSGADPAVPEEPRQHRGVAIIAERAKTSPPEPIRVRIRAADLVPETRPCLIWEEQATDADGNGVTDDEGNPVMTETVYEGIVWGPRINGLFEAEVDALWFLPEADAFGRVADQVAHRLRCEKVLMRLSPDLAQRPDIVRDLRMLELVGVLRVLGYLSTPQPAEQEGAETSIPPAVATTETTST